jgi:uncharacterized protein (DUF433 family)
MTLWTPEQHIEITPGICGGKPRIAGHRITVQQIAIWFDRMGRSADEIATEYDLELSNVHAAMAYYFDHREEIDRSIRESSEWIDELRRKTPSLVAEKLGRKPADG